MIELVVVIAILAILVLIAIPRFAGFTGSANERAILADVKILESAAIAFASEDPTVDLATVDIGTDLTTYVDADIITKYDAVVTFTAEGRANDFDVDVNGTTYSYTAADRTVTH